MEMCRGVSTTSLPSAMDTSDRCSCPHTSTLHPLDTCKRVCSYYLRLPELKMCKRIFIALLVVLNLVLADSTPVHRVRHGHDKRVMYAHRLCESPGVTDRPTHAQCPTLVARVRRDVDTMDLEEGKESALCPYSVCVDEDIARRPVQVHRVFCLHSGCRCTQEGAYRCTQLYNEVEVWYPSTNATQHLRVEYGCVCAARHGNQVDPLELDTGDK